jgi:hypothetical protein
VKKIIEVKLEGGVKTKCALFIFLNTREHVLHMFRIFKNSVIDKAKLRPAGRLDLQNFKEKLVFFSKYI